MLRDLKLWNFQTSIGFDSPHLKALLGPLFQGEAFVLRTCQRTLVLRWAPDYTLLQDIILPSAQGEGAYLFLLETICGLKSKLVGENEIVGQFKTAYQSYCQTPLKDTRLQMILEKLFKDAKDIRTQYLIGISQKTYASLTRRHIIQKGKASRVVVVGSGAMAEDLINQFKKKAQVVICARNEQRASELSQEHGLEIWPWKERLSLLKEPFIANTVGADDILFDEAFFDSWSSTHEQRMFVDLGSPSSIKTKLDAQDKVIRLKDIFNEGAILEDQKYAQIELARRAMQVLALRRVKLFEEKLSRLLPILPPQTIPDMRYL